MSVAAKIAATIDDARPGTHYGTLGMCLVTGGPCAPSPVTPSWTNPFPAARLGDIEGLLLGACLACSLGGQLYIAAAGQVTFLMSRNRQLLEEERRRATEGPSCRTEAVLAPRGDTVFVGADGQNIIARGTQEEVEAMRRGHHLSAQSDELDEYREGPGKYYVQKTLDEVGAPGPFDADQIFELSDAAHKTYEQRRKNRKGLVSPPARRGR